MLGMSEGGPFYKYDEEISSMRELSKDGVIGLDDVSNLTRNQLLVWMDQKSHPGIPLYNMAATFTILGKIDPQRFQRAFQTLLDKTDALRLIFEEKNGAPRQRLVSQMPYTTEYLNFSEPSDPDKAFDAWVQERCIAPFDLQKRLFDSVLAKLSDDRFVWYFNAHHLIVDGWSIALTFQRMSALYQDFSNGRLHEEKDFPRFLDYLADEHSYRRSSQFLAAEKYWKEKLSKRVEPLKFYSASSARETLSVARVQCKLGLERSTRLKAIAAEAGFSAFNLNLSLFNIFTALTLAYLYRISGNRLLALGVPFNNRSSVTLRETVGLLMEVAPLQVEISEGETFVSLIRKAMAESAGTLRHYRYSPGNPVNNRSYEVTLNYQATSYPGFGGFPVQTRWIHSGYEVDKLGLQIHDFAGEGSIAIEFDFNTGVFDAEQQKRTIQHFLKIVDSFLEDKTKLLNHIDLLSAEERQRIFFEFNQKTLLPPEDQTVVDLFEQQARLTPGQLAVVDAEQSLTCEELNCRANQLANYLCSLGIGPEALVGICVDRSLEMVVGLLGILKAGAAYVPLDPAYPQERLKHMLDDTQIEVLLTQKRLISNLPRHEARMVFLDSDWDRIKMESSVKPDVKRSGRSLAYIIYTSGSTGKPKGVMIEHASLLNYVKVASDRFAMKAEDRVLQFASINFDTSAEEVYPCLTRGATLVLRNDAMMDSISSFLETCRSWKITVLDLPTAFWHELVNGLSSENIVLPPAIRLVIIGGEKASVESLRKWHQYVEAPVRLLNTYGPTESTIVATIYDLSSPESVSHTHFELPIGSPIRNLQTYVLDAALQPVPIGVSGELHIGGLGLARGYLGASALTAEKFIPDPFSDVPGARMYKTGDLVQWLPDGNLGYLGRIDHQVKIRGFRVELGEIEAVLSTHRAVREAVVLAQEGVASHKRLVAYLVLDNHYTFINSEMRAYLRDKLPDYMIPSAFVTLDRLPLTPSGKVDRQALPDPDWSGISHEEGSAAPTTDIEKTLAGIWSQVLGVENVGVHDNFFELGGDSILSIQLIAKANLAGIRFSAAHIIKHQTIAELALVAGTSGPIHAEQGVVTGSVPFTPYQHWFFEQNLPDPHHWNMVLLLEVREKLNYDLVQEVLQQLTVHHDALRLRFLRDGSGWKQINTGVDETAPDLFVRLDLSALSEKEQDSAIKAAADEQQASLNLAGGPLLRVVLFELGGNRPDRLLVIVHHMVIDGISLRILLEDLETGYRQLNSGNKISLPPKTSSYKQWAKRLSDYAQSDALVQEMSYWSGVGGISVPPMPVDYAGGANTWGSTKIVRVALDSAETHALLQEAPAAYNTQINDLLLTALVLAFSDWTGSKSLLFDLEGHGREDIIADVDLSRTVGCFTSLFPVVMDLEETFDLGSQLKLVKEILRAIPNRGIGYGVLRYLCNRPDVADKLKAMPRAEICFNYLGQFDQVLPSSSPFSLADGEIGTIRSPRETRRYLLEILGRTVHDQLQMDFIYSENVHRRGTIERLAGDFMGRLRTLIDHCRSAEAGGYTPSDFPAAKLDQKTLDLVLAKLAS
jgi:amino acid adenylation domain-containing protein/non-ribosomal peptide synthase protein (TIGR01720 family)